mgnify:CR=1 FL=1
MKTLLEEWSEVQMKRSVCSLVTVLGFLLPCQLTAFANSSWRWISSVRPYTVFPVVIVITLAIECSFIYFFANVKHWGKILLVVGIGNLLSFIAPSLLEWFWGMGQFGIGYLEYLDKLPIYMVSVAYLLLTLLVEVPLVYLFFRKKAESKKRLLLAVLLSNGLTTLFTFVAERLFCHGAW